MQVASVIRTVQDKYLPPDHEAFVAAEPPTGRIIVIAPTRAACETIELALGLHIPTLLEKQHGAEIRELAAAGKGFGIVAGTGTGKTLTLKMAAGLLRPSQGTVEVLGQEISSMSERDLLEYTLAVLPRFLSRLGVRGTMLLGLGSWAASFLMLTVGAPFGLVVASMAGNGLAITGFLVAGQVFAGRTLAPAACPARIVSASGRIDTQT